MPFQKQVHMTQAPAVAGDFASTNPRASLLTIPGGFVAGAGGVNVGTFVWADATGAVLTNSGTGIPAGFVGRTMQALITGFLSESGNNIPQGVGVGDVFRSGDFWATNAGASAVTVGMKAFANLSDGTISFAAPGATVKDCIETKFCAATAGAAGELVKITDIL